MSLALVFYRIVPCVALLYILNNYELQAADHNHCFVCKRIWVYKLHKAIHIYFSNK